MQFDLVANHQNTKLRQWAKMRPNERCLSFSRMFTSINLSTNSTPLVIILAVGEEVLISTIFLRCSDLITGLVRKHRLFLCFGKSSDLQCFTIL